MSPESKRLQALALKVLGQTLYDTFTKQERRVVQFGMFPHEKITAFNERARCDFQIAEGREPSIEEMQDISRLLAVAVMDAANRGPNKMVV